MSLLLKPLGVHSLEQIKQEVRLHWPQSYLKNNEWIVWHPSLKQYVAVATVEKKNDGYILHWLYRS